MSFRSKIEFTCQCECKHCHKCKKDYSWNPSKCICDNRKYLKSIANTSVIECDEIITVMDIVSTKMRSTIATNVTSTTSIFSKILLYFAYSFISDHVTINNYCYVLLLRKTKRY